MRSSIVHWLEELNPKQRECWPAVSVCSAMNRPPWKTWAPRLVLTRERVRQIQVEGLRRLREILLGQGLSIEALFRTN
jgi:RNA polymerase nonessential primary-like sigma factor